MRYAICLYNVLITIQCDIASLQDNEANNFFDSCFLCHHSRTLMDRIDIDVWRYQCKSIIGRIDAFFEVTASFKEYI